MVVLDDYKHSEITSKIIGCAISVHNALGAGFIEKVYENALSLELTIQGHSVKQQHPIAVYYRDLVVGEYTADLVVDDKVIVELKAVTSLAPIHEVQLVHYLRATGMEVGLVLNFGQSLTHKRKFVALRPANQCN